MKKLKHLCVTLVCMISVQSIHAQVTSFFDDFNDHDLSQSPVWLGDLNKFENLRDYLQSASDVVNDTFILFTPVRAASEVELSCSLKLPFSTSSVNYLDVFFTSDTPVGTSRDVYARIGGKNDQVALYETTPSGTVLLAAGPEDETHKFEGQVTLRKEISGQWELSYSHNGAQQPLVMDSIELTDKFDWNYVGLRVRQSTSSFHRKHIVDDFYFGPIRRDSLPPVPLHVEPVSDSSLVVIFDEAIDEDHLDSVKAQIGSSRANTIKVQGKRLELKFKDKFANGSMNLNLSGVYDLSGNRMSDTVLLFEYVYLGTPQRFDILITEVMPDPTPVIGLPEVEYMELYNASDSSFDLKCCTISDPSGEIELPRYIIRPGEYVVLCDTVDAYQFSQKANVLGLRNFITLNNANDSLWLRNGKEDLHTLAYSNEWHETDWKRQGGWSLEVIDPSLPCLAATNWTSSQDDKGGTPGGVNSVNAATGDHRPPFVISASLEPSQSIRLKFSESILFYEVRQNHFGLDIGVLDSVRKEGTHELVLELEQAIQKGRVYTVQIGGVYDCVGNVMVDTTIRLAIPESMATGELLINEVLFDPIGGGSDFVELYNPTDKVFTLSDLHIGRKDSLGGWKEFRQVSFQEHLIFPSEYVVLTSDPGFVKEQYPGSLGKHFFQTKLPVLPNESGDVGIGLRNGAEIDWFRYSSSMHFKLLDATEGVSLERRRPDRPTNEADNWTSASFIEGYATPGYANSQLEFSEPSGNTYAISPDPMTPNGDGVDDCLIIEFNPYKSNVNLNIRIFDHVGRLVDFPVNTVLCGETNRFRWNGVTQNGALAQPGVYVVMVEAIATDGTRYNWKKGFTLVY